MIRSSRFAPGAALVVTLSVVAACHHKPVATIAPTPVPNADSIAAARRDSIARADAARLAAARDRARADSLQRARDEAARLAAAAEAARRAVTATVYFAFDQSALSDTARTTLDAMVPVLTSSAGLRLRITGNADERGSDEYNLALGERRAASAKQYLVNHGIDGGRLETASLGEERPACQEHNEGCWAQNRRDTFEITAGGDALGAARP